MATNDKNKNHYPEEYAHIEEKVKELQERVKNLEKLKEENKGVSQHNLNYNPPGFNPPGIIQTQKSTIVQRSRDFDKEIEFVKSKGFEEIEKSLKADKSEVAKTIREQVREEFFPNELLSMEEKEAAKLPEQSKDIEASQNFTDYLRLKSQNKLPVRPEKIEARTIDDSQRFSIDAINFFKDKKQKEQPEKEVAPKESLEKPDSHSISMRFSQSLGYTKTLENSNKEKSPTRDKADRDRE